MCRVERCLVCGAQPYHAGHSCIQGVNSTQLSNCIISDASSSSSSNITSLSEAASQEFSILSDPSIKRCPRCSNGIVKESGCDKLKCRCGYRFCFGCGSENAQCPCTPAYHGFIDNITGGGDFTHLADTISPT